jgi:hypothetical protein
VGTYAGNGIKGGKVYEEMSVDPVRCLMSGTGSIRK